MVRFLFLFLTIFTTIWAQDAQLEKVKIKLKWLHQFQFAGYYAAIEKGYYKEEGLDVELVERDLEKGVAQTILDKDAQYGIFDSSIVLERLNNKPLVLLLQIFQHSPHVLIALKDSGIISPYELIGKTVCLDVKSSGDAAIRAMLLNTLSDTSNIKMVHQTFDYDSLTRGEVDAISSYVTDEPYSYKEKGVEINIISPTNYGIDFYGDNLFTTEEEILHHPKRVEKIIRATLKGWEYALANKQEIIRIIKEKYKSRLSIDHLLYEAEMTERMILPDVIKLGNVDKNRYKKIAQTYKELGLAKKDEIPGNFFYDTFVSHNINLTQEEKIWLEKHSKLRLGIDINWAPFEFVQEGEYKGIAADYVNLLHEMLGVEFIIDKNLAWSEVIERAKAKEIDMLACLVKTDDRIKYLNFTDNYLNFVMAIVTKDDEGFIDNIKELNGKKVAVVKGYMTEDIIKKNHKEIDLLPAKDIEEALRFVSEGKAYALLDNIASIGYYIKKLGITNLKISGQTEYSFALGMGTRNDEPILASIIQKALNAIPETKKEEIYQKWIKLKFQSVTDYTFIAKITGIFLLLIGVLSFWILTMSRQIKKRKLAENRYKMLSDMAFEAVIVMKQGRVVDVNKSALEMFGFERDEILGKSPFDLMPESEHEKVRQKIAQDDSLPYESAILSKEGNIPVELRGRNYSIDGETIRVANLRDIRVYKELEESYKRFNHELVKRVESEVNFRLRIEKEKEMSDKLFAVIFDSVEVGISITNNEGQIIKANETFKKLFGMDDKDLAESEFYDIFGKEKKEEFRELYTKSIYTVDSDLLSEVTAYSKQGARLDVLLTTAKIVDKNEATLIVTTFSDISSIKKLEDEKRMQEQILIQQSKMASMGEMIAAIAHQWKQPLNGIYLTMQIIEDKISSEEKINLDVHDNIERIYSLIEFMGHTINDFRSFFNPDKNKSLFDLTRTIQSVASLVYPQLKSNHIELIIDADEGYSVFGYLNEFKQVILNIISNSKDAILGARSGGKLSDDALIRITVNKKEDFFVIEIADNGGGIDEKLLPDKLFEPYVSTKGSNGTGIGLSMSRTIIQKHANGRLEAYNRENGAVFRILLPVAS